MTTDRAPDRLASASRSSASLWLAGAATLAALPIAWLAATLGFGLPTGDPLRTLPVLLLLSVAEEIVFRGGVQPWLATRIGARDGVAPGLTLSNLATSIVFASLHLLRHPPLAALAVLPASLVLGALRERSGRVWPAALLHAWFNVALYLASALHAGAA